MARAGDAPARAQPSWEIVVFDEDELLPISALQHLLFCERQCALIHIEGLWAENRLTVEGNRLHARAHGERKGPRGGGMIESRAGVATMRSIPLRSFRLGLAGIADVVELDASDARAGALKAAGTQKASDPSIGRGIPFPIEYKRGRPKRRNWDRVQLCAQALCLEEMLGAAVPRGAMFYGAIRRREPVAFTSALRAETEAAAARLHEMIRAGRTPVAVFEKKCMNCSLVNLCLPRATTGRKSARTYLQTELRASMDNPSSDESEP